MKKVVLAWGRMNPPTAGHELICKSMSTEDGDKKLYLSHTNDHKENPLPYERKYYWCEKAFSSYVEVVKSDLRQFLKVLVELYEQGYDEVVIVTGSDRSSELSLALEYNGKEGKPHGYYNFKEISPLVVGKDRNINEDDLPIESVSASRQREFAREGELEEFIKYCPSTLSEDECEELYNDVRKGMGLFETLEELHLDEKLNVSEREIIKNSILSNIDKKVLDNSKTRNRKDKTNELFNISRTSAITEDELLKGISNGIKKTKLVKLNNNKDVKLSLIDYGIHNEISNKFPSFLIEVEGNDGNIDYLYISYDKTLASTLDIEITSKTFTPSEIGLGSNSYQHYQEIPGKIDHKDSTIKYMLKTIVSDVIKSAKVARGDSVLSYLRREEGSNISESTMTIKAKYNISKYIKEIGNDVFGSLISPLKNNFGEVFGACALAVVLDPEKAEVFFPTESNYPMVDYSIKGLNRKTGDDFMVSAKAGAGGKPGATKPIEKMYEKYGPGDFGKRFYPFIKWMHENVSSESVDIPTGYENLAKLAVKGAPWYRGNKSLVSQLGDFAYPGSVKTKNDFKKFMNLIFSLDLIKKKDYNNLINYPGDKTLYETIRTKYVCHIAINSINNDKELMLAFNSAFSDLYGTFIQVYLDDRNKDNFYTGDMTFNCVLVSADNKPLSINSAPKYEFLDNSGIDKTTHKLSTTKLSIVLKH